MGYFKCGKRRAIISDLFPVSSDSLSLGMRLALSEKKLDWYIPSKHQNLAFSSLCEDKAKEVFSASLRDKDFYFLIAQNCYLTAVKPSFAGG